MLVRHVPRFEDVWEWSIVAADSLDRGFEVEEALVLDGGRHFGAKTAGDWRFVGDHEATRLGHRIANRVLRWKVFKKIIS